MTRPAGKRQRKEETALYRKLRNILCEKIFQGEYGNGALLPTERALAGAYAMSRVTVRKSFELMEREGLVSREQGRGTIFRARSGGYASALDTIALVAPTNSPFFAAFFTRFSQRAEQDGSLVVLTQSTGHKKGQLEELLFKLYVRDIRNYVLWPYGDLINMTAVERIRSLGANVVLFDRITETRAADCVSVDNQHAIRALYEHTRSQGHETIHFVGWDNIQVSSTRDREEAFKRCAGPNTPLHRIPWRDEQETDQDCATLLMALKQSQGLPQAIVCGNGTIGIAVKKQLRLIGREQVHVCCVDDLPGAAEMDLTAYAQPMTELALRVYQQLLEQNRSPETWKARTYAIQGTLLRR